MRRYFLRLKRSQKVSAHLLVIAEGDAYSRDMQREKNPNENEILKLVQHPFPKQLEAVNRAVLELGRAHMALGAWEGQTLRALIEREFPQKMLEVGTLAGGSALWFLSALKPGSVFFTLEKDPKCFRHAFEILKTLDSRKYDVIAQEARVLALEKFNGDKVTVVLLLGDAQERLQQLVEWGPFDVVFLDGAKADYPTQAAWAFQNLKSQGVLLGDNVLLAGEVFAEKTEAYSAQQKKAMQEFHAYIWDSKKFVTTVLPFLEGLSFSIRK